MRFSNQTDQISLGDEFSYYGSIKINKLFLANITK